MDMFEGRDVAVNAPAVLDTVAGGGVAIIPLSVSYGLTSYQIDRGLGSTIVELPSYRTLRAGCVYDAFCRVFRSEAAIDLMAINDS